MNNKEKEIGFTSYLVVECLPLDDQWECSCNRIPMAIVKNKKDAFDEKLNPTFFEVYGITETGSLVQLKEYYE